MHIWNSIVGINGGPRVLLFGKKACEKKRVLKASFAGSEDCRMWYDLVVKNQKGKLFVLESDAELIEELPREMTVVKVTYVQMSEKSFS